MHYVELNWIFLILAFIFHVPRLMWKGFEDKLFETLIKKGKGDKEELMQKRGTFSSSAYFFCLCEAAVCVLSFLAIYLLDLYFQGQFLSF